MEVKELGHVVLYVRDVDISSYFYREVLGWRPITEGSRGSLPFRGAAFNSPGGRTHHELLLIEVGPDAVAIPHGRRVGMYHFGLKIGSSDDELREAVRALQQSGVTVLGATDHGMTHSVYVADPDGNEIELYVDVPGVDWEDPTLWTNPVLRPLQL